MVSEAIDDAIASAAFRFFYAFSRFEFALKEAGYVRAIGPNQAASPD